MSNKQVIITIAGPSTSGKSTLANLFKPEGYQEIVSTTTRPPRTGEIHGVHYYFVSPEDFQIMISDNHLVEHAPVGKYLYGVSKQAIQDVLSSGNSAVLVLEPNGALEVAKFCKEINIINHKVFINNPIDVLIERLYERKKNDQKATEEVYKEREFNIRVIEPQQWTAPAYSGEHFYDQVFDTFNNDNQANVFNSIKTSVSHKLNKKSSFKIK